MIFFRSGWWFCMMIGMVWGPLSAVHAQQDPLFTKYMFNTLVYNPAFAGNQGALAAQTIFRQQWLGIQDAPRTLACSVHAPTPNDRVGLGLVLLSDRAGAMSQNIARLAYAYRVRLGASTLSAGLQASISNLRHDWSDLHLFAEGDVAFSEVQTAQWLPNFGFGLYFRHPRFYAGLSAPELLQQDMGGLRSAGRKLTHLYFAAGGLLPLSDSWEFKPSFLLQAVSPSRYASSWGIQEWQYGAPLERDLDLSLLYDEWLWMGVSVRTAMLALAGKESSFDSFDVWVAFYLEKGLRVGVAYDYPLSRISSVSAGSLELMVGYEWERTRDRVVTPRYF